jgi:hypothetical protein
MITGIGGIVIPKKKFITLAFSPANISGLELWLKSDAGVLDASDNPITSDNTAVKTWQDQSGNGLHATQSNSSWQPVWRNAANGINGNPAVYFSGDIMATANLTAGVYTIFAVHKATFDGLIYERSASVNSYDGEYLYTHTNSTIAVRRTPPNSNSIVLRKEYQSNWGIGNTNKITCHQFDGTIDGMILRVNGSEVSLSHSYIYDPTTTSATNPLYIGARSGRVAPVTGYIAEILYYGSVLSASDIESVENYLTNKWGT